MTKKKLSFYKELLKVVCKDPSVGLGFCYYVSYAMDKWYYQNGVEPIDAYFDKQSWSELCNRLPKPGINSEGYSFPRTHEGWKKRIEILHNLIQEEETKNK